jgi:hypothetical protein
LSDFFPDRFDRARRRALLATVLLGLGNAHAASPRLEPFTELTWQEWQQKLPRPAIVVFSTTYCATCPQAFADLAAAVRKSGTGVPLIAVVMDAEGKGELPHLKHYRHADRIFVFQGPEAALRFSVNPRWRGVTPYVALFASDGEPRLIAGAPSAEDLRVVLRR